jgi:hypothetical protein
MNTNKISAVQHKSHVTKMGEDIRKVVAIIHKYFYTGEVIKDLEKYVEHYKPEFQAAGPELKFLGLAKIDRRSPLGWAPTTLLMDFVSGNIAPKESKLLYEAFIFWELLEDCVFGYNSDRTKSSLVTPALLEGLHLVQRPEDDDADWVTESLHNLFNNGYLDKRTKGKLPFRCEVFHAVRVN